MIPEFKANAHLHLPPNFSAFDTVAQAVELAAEQGVRVVGANNYYDYHVYGEFARLCNANGIYPLFGIEIIALLDDLVKAGIKINDPGNPGKMYVCGKGITQFEEMTPEATELLATIRHNDSTRMEAITEKLADVFAAAGLETGLNAEAVKQQIVARHGSPLETVYLQERHIAQAFQEAIFAQLPLEVRGAFLEKLFGTPSKAKSDDTAALQNEIRSHLMKAGKPAFVPETFVGFDHAYRLVLALGGIPCYPVLIDGANPLCGYEADVDALIAATHDRRIFCNEFIPIRNTPEILTRYVLALRRAGFVVTAGTEHNTRDLIPIAPTCLDGEPIPDEVDAIFREGACVVAAHQYLTQNGKPGFVDSNGNPNPDYPDSESRIAAFAKLGAELISSEQSMLQSRTNSMQGMGTGR